MKTNSFFASAFFITLAIALSFSSSVARAAACTPPTPPVCYTTKSVPVYSSQGGTTASDGAIILGDGMVILPNGAGIVQNPMKQVQIQAGCDGTTLGIQYQADMLSYNACQSAGSNPSNLNDLIGQSAANTFNCMKLGTWFEYDDKTQSCVDTKQTQLNLACTNILGAQGSYNEAGDKCTCKSGYEIGTSGQCVESTSWCSNQHGTHAHILQYNGENYCGCDDGYTTDANKQCVLMGPTYCVDTYGINSHQKGAGCVCNDGYKGGANKQCVSNAVGNTNVSSTLPVAIMDSANGTVLCHENHGTHSHILQYIGPGYSCGCDEGYTMGTNAQCVSSTADSIIAQRKAALGMPPGKIVEKYGASPTTTSVVAATTAGSVASSTPAPVPKQKHWYEWLNPINWFSWLH